MGKKASPYRKVALVSHSRQTSHEFEHRCVIRALPAGLRDVVAGFSPALDPGLAQYPGKGNGDILRIDGDRYGWKAYVSRKISKGCSLHLVREGEAGDFSRESAEEGLALSGLEKPSSSKRSLHEESQGSVTR